jgi:kinesin family member C1
MLEPDPVIRRVRFKFVVPTLMSRLPRLASSPVPPIMAESGALKRKAGARDNQELTDKPRKLAATASRRSNVLRPSRTATNQPQTSLSKSARLPAPLTKPYAPKLATTTNKGVSGRTSRSASTSSTRTNVTTRASARAAASRINPNPKVCTSGDTESRLLSIETALAESKAQVEASMAVERAKVAELQASQLALTRQLAKGHTVPYGTLNTDDLEAERRKYRRELEEFEAELRKKERKEREINEDLRLMGDDLQRERDAISQLKSALSQQSTAQLALRTQNEALEAQNLVAQSERDAVQAENARLRLELEEAAHRIAELELEAREAEMHRRKLHNTVQELKGNIRVFCRVRPILQSEREAGALDAGWAYPDKRDKREIVVSSSSESAMGQERKEIYLFKFDQVRTLLLWDRFLTIIQGFWTSYNARRSF